jgi:hypothetical protein
MTSITHAEVYRTDQDGAGDVRGDGTCARGPPGGSPGPPVEFLLRGEP